MNKTFLLPYPKPLFYVKITYAILCMLCRNPDMLRWMHIVGSLWQSHCFAVVFVISFEEGFAAPKLQTDLQWEENEIKFRFFDDCISYPYWRNAEGTVQSYAQAISQPLLEFVCIVLWCK